jgi:hypothetical protein
MSIAAAIIGGISTAASLIAKGAANKKKREAEKDAIEAAEAEAAELEAGREGQAEIRLENLGGVNDAMAELYGEDSRRDLSPEGVFGDEHFADEGAEADAEPEDEEFFAPANNGKKKQKKDFSGGGY